MLHFFRKTGIAALLILVFTAIASGQSISPIATQVQNLQASGVFFEAIQPFSPAYRPLLPPENSVRAAQFLELDTLALQHIWQNRPAAIHLEIPYNGSTIACDLYEAPVLSPSFAVITSADPGNPAYYTPGVYYRGTESGQPNSLVTISCFDGEMMGIVSDNAHGNMVLGRLEGAGNRQSYVLYEEKNLPVTNPFECHTAENDHIKVPGQLAQPETDGCVEVFFECDYALYQNKGTVVNTVNFVTGLFNQVTSIYTNESITVTISQIYIWTTPDSYSNSSSNAALNDFMALRTNFNGTVAHLLSLGTNNLGGVAYVDVLCVTPFAYGFSNIFSYYYNFPTYSWSVGVVTHELGHNMGSNHTHWCGWPVGALDNCYPTEGGCPAGPAPIDGGTIMSYCHNTSYGINFNNGFGTYPGNAIRDGVSFANANGCVSSACTSYSCDPPVASLSNIATNGATVSWTAIGGASSYNLQYRVVGTGAWTTLNNVSSPYALSGLQDGTNYELQMQAVCGGSASRYGIGVIFKTQYADCTAPGNFTNPSFTNNSSTVHWTEFGMSTSWEVQYGPRGFTLGSGTTLTANSTTLTINGLSPSLSYDFYVRANCGGGGYSNWGGPGVMSTSLQNDSPTGAVLLTVNGSCPGQNAYRNIGATLQSGEYDPIYPNNGYWGDDADNTVWFKFVAPSSGTVKITTDISPQGTLNDAEIALYAVTNVNNMASFVYLSSNEDGGVVGTTYCPFLYYTGLTPGSTYYIQVDGWTETGYFCIEVYEDLALGNPGNSCNTYSETVNGASFPNKWFNLYTKPNQYNIGLPVAALKTSQNLGSVTLSAIRKNSVPTSTSGVKYMQRYFNFNAAQNNSGNKQIRLLYTNTEFSNLQAATGNFGTTDDLNISHYDGVNEDCLQSNSNNGVYTVITSVTPTNVASSGNFFLEFQSPGFSEMGAHFGTTALPVELLGFYGKPTEAANVLSWQTASEKDLAQFVLQRSADGIDNWLTIGKTPATNDASGGNYALTDRSPLHRAYYRLQVQELDGSIQYSSNEVVIERNDLPSGLEDLYPNPASDRLFLHYFSEKADDLALTVHFSDGTPVLSHHFSVEKGENKLEISVRDLPAGAYLLRLQKANAVESRYFIRR